ncbi:MAG: PIN domain-containing protein [Oscillospiraceae bacterium]|nr:PIN domain-containing protein [Oscillospiraceae bacterium]
MESKAFVDTNVFAYLYTDDEPEKRECAVNAINAFDCFLSTQTLNEFCNICTKKWRLPLSDIRRALKRIYSCGTLLPIDFGTIDKALDLYEKYNYSYYDCLMLASAINADCEYILSEDMADGQIIEGCLKILNIFAG